MKRTKIGSFEAVAETMKALGSHGCLLVAGAERVNPMTIGWGMMGIAWGKPVFIVMVRPSRYTAGLMDRAKAFSVNVPPEALHEVCVFCGTKSGRDVDKVKETGITVQPGKDLDVPTIVDCPIHYECRILHRNAVDPEELAAEVNLSNYPRGDYHYVYWGEIVGAFKRA